MGLRCYSALSKAICAFLPLVDIPNMKENRKARKHHLSWSKEVSQWNFRQYGQMEKRRWEESERRREEVRRWERRKSEKKEEAGARKGRKVATHCVFPRFAAPEGRKVRFAKRWVRSHVVRWEMKSCMPLWREAHFQVKMYKAHQGGSTFRSFDVEKVHAIVVRSTF